jgi:hypothetical protein
MRWQNTTFDFASHGPPQIFVVEVFQLPTRGLYNGKYPPPPGGGGNIIRCHFGEKILKSQEKKAENLEEKGRKWKEKGRKGKEN